MTTPRLLRIALNVSDLHNTCRFYCEALGFVALPAGAETQLLACGAEQIELTVPHPPGAPYPCESTAADLWFQHFAIVVPDMAAAYARLTQHGAMPITHGEPVRLPAASGAVTAWKFRDPDGHPLELLAFPDRANRPGIDHTAISVADVARSIAFYTRLGLRTGSRQRNAGPEQDRLDGLEHVSVDVVTLQAHGPPHVELLGYRNPRGRSSPVAANDIAATRMVFESTAQRAACLHDPDGHRVALQPRP